MSVHRAARGSPVAQVFNLWIFIATRGATHAPSPDAHCGHATVAPSPPSRRRLRLTVAGRGPAPSILPFARSMLPPLRHRGCASEATPAPGAQAAPRYLVAVRRWQKARSSSGCNGQNCVAAHTAAGPDGRLADRLQRPELRCSTTRRRPGWPAHRQAATATMALQPESGGHGIRTRNRFLGI